MSRAPRAILIKGGRLIDPSQAHDAIADLLLVGGSVAGQGANIGAPEGAELIDATGLVVAPGLVDLHAHLREPGREDAETIATGARAAVAGGFTSVCAMPNTDPVCDNQAAVGFVLAQAHAAQTARVYPIGSVSMGQKGEQLTEFGELVAAGAVAVSDDGRPVATAHLMRTALEYARTFGIPVIDHCEDRSLAEGGAMHEGLTSTRLGLKGMPRSAEDLIVARDILLAELTGGHVHLAHMSTAGAVRLIREAKSRGVNVTAEVTPHHLTLTDVCCEGYNTNAKMNPPLREPHDVTALKEALRDGTIDCIATDHAPHPYDAKEQEFDFAPFGGVGLETALGLAMVVGSDPNLVWFYNERFEADCCWGRFDKVLGGLDRELKRDPRNARAMALKAEVLRMPAFSRFAEALAALERAVVLEPRTAWIRAFLGRARLHTGQPEEAISDLRRAAVADSSCGWMRAWLGEAYFNTGRYRLALAELDGAIAADPECAVAYSFRGATQEKLAHFDLALADLNRALELHRRYAETYVWPSQSTRDWEELIRIDLFGLSLERGFVFYSRARAKQGLDDWDGAVVDMTQAMLLDSKYSWADGSCEASELRSVLAGLNKALRRNPLRASTYAWRGEILLRLGCPQKALFSLSKAVLLEQNCAWAQACYAQARLQLGHIKEALDISAKALRLDGACVRAHAVQAQSWQAAGKTLAARRAIDRLLKRDPKLAWAFCWRGELRLKLADARGALGDLNRAVQLHPQYANAYFWRAKAQHLLGNDQKALSDFNIARRLDPEINPR